MELKLVKYGNRSQLKNCPENKALLEELFRDYALVGTPADEAEGEEAVAEVNVEEPSENSKDADLFISPPEEN